MKEEFEHLTTFIRPQKGWKLIDVAELIRYKDLLYFLTVRGVKAKYAQSVLGVGWAVIQPLFSALVFTVVFGNLAKVKSDGVPYFIFSMVALVPWTYFSNTLVESANSLVTNANMISKVYFPRLVLPLSSALSKALDFIIGFILMIVFLLIYRIPFEWSVLYLPLLLLILLMTSLGLGMILSAMAVQYRDIRHAISFLVQLLMYLAPVVYPTSNIPDRYQIGYALNPMVGVIEGFRSIFLHTQSFPWQWVLTGLAVSSVIFVFSAFYFRKMERIFADVA